MPHSGEDTRALGWWTHEGTNVPGLREYLFAALAVVAAKTPYQVKTQIHAQGLGPLTLKKMH